MPHSGPNLAHCQRVVPISKELYLLAFHHLVVLRMFAMRCGVILGHFQYHTLWCDLVKIITESHLIFVVICAVWCGLEFNQNHNRTAPHFYGHMCNTIYKIRFEVGIFFKFWAFSTQPKTNFFLFFLVKFLIIKLVFLYFGLAFLVNTCQGY